MEPIRLEIFLDDKTAAGIGSASKGLKGMEQVGNLALQSLQTKMDALQAKIKQLNAQGIDTTTERAQLEELKKSLAALTSELEKMKLSSKDLKNGIAEIKEETDLTTRSSNGMNLSISQLIGTIGGFTALKSFTSELVNVRGEFQQLEIAFSTMLKSKEKADKLMAELVDIAAKTPFDLQGVASSAKQMLAYGSSAEDVGNELVMLGNVAAGVGSQLSEIAYLYGTLRTQGTAYATDIRQFAGRGIPIYEELAKVLGVTKDKVSALVSDGKVGFKEVEQAFKNMTSESGIYYNLMQEQSKSLTGQMSNLEDSWNNMLNDLGKNVQGIASTGISGLNTIIENYEKLGETIMTIVTAYGTYKAALISVAAYQKAVTGVRYSVEIAELSKLIPAKQAEAKTELEQAVASGKLTQAKAEQITAMRTEAAAHVQLLQNKAAEAVANYNAATSQAALAALDLESAETAVAASEMEYQAALKSGNAKRLETAETQLNVAMSNKYAASKALEAARSQVATTATKASTASKAAETAATALQTSAEVANTKATTLLTAAKTKLLAVSKAIGLSMLANPYVLAAAAITGLIYTIYKYTTATTAAEAAQDAFNKTMGQSAKNAENLNNKINDLVQVIKSPDSSKLQKTLAFDDLSRIAPSITDTYKSVEELNQADLSNVNKQLNELSDERRIQNLQNQANELREIIKSFNEISNRDSYTSVDVNRNALDLQELRNKLKNSFDIEGSAFWGNDDWVEAARSVLQKINAELFKIDQAKKSLEQPTEMEVKIAETAYNDAKNKFDLLSEFADSMKREIENPIRLVVDGNKAFRSTDDIMEEIRNKINSLDKIPLSVEKQKVKNELQEVLNYMEQWKSESLKNGIFTIPLYFNLEIHKAEQNKNLTGQKFNYITGKYEELKKEPVLFQDLLRNARKEWQTAAKEYKRLYNSKKATDEEVLNAKKNLDSAKEKYEGLGGNTSNKSSDKTKTERERKKKEEEQLQKERINLYYKNQQKEIDLMAEGSEKKRAQLALDYQKQLDDIKELEKKLSDASGGKLNNKDLEQVRKAYGLADNEYLQGVAAIDKEEQDEKQKHLDELLKKYQDFEAQRKALQEQTDQDIRDLQDKRNTNNADSIDAAIEEARKQLREGLEAINSEEASQASKDSPFLRNLFGDYSEMAYQDLKKLIAQARQLQNYLNGKGSKEGITFIDPDQLAAIEQSPDDLDRLRKALKQLLQEGEKGDKWTQLLQRFKKGLEDLKNADDYKDYAQGIGEISAVAGEAAGSLAEMAENMGAGGLANALGNLQTAMNSISAIGEGFAKGGILGGVMATISETAKLFAKGAAEEQKHQEALEALMEQRLAQQRAYNLLLMEQNLEYEKAETVFGSDPYGKAINSLKVYKQAIADLNKELHGDGKADSVHWWERILAPYYSELREQIAYKDQYAGLADVQIKTGSYTTGAWFWKKQHDEYGSVLDEYPELLDAQGNFNKELAQTILDTREMSDESRAALENFINLAEKQEEALSVMKDYLTDIFGELGGNLSDALTDAFRNGSDAAQEFEKSVVSMLENLAQQMAYSVTLAPIFEQASVKMLEVMKTEGLTPEEQFKRYTDIIADTMNQGLAAQDDFNRLLEAAKQAAAEKGLDLFQPEDSSGSSQSASVGGYAALTQEQGTKLEGLFTGVYDRMVSIQNLMVSLQKDRQADSRLLAQIAENTAYCRYLLSIYEMMERMDREGITVR